MNEVEHSELSIESSLLAFEQGLLSLDQVQRITNQTLNIKYKAELASQDYHVEVDSLNEQIAHFGKEYKPLLQRLQQSEESRINFLKYNVEKFVKHVGGMGKGIVEKSAEMAKQVAMVNSDTDLRIFVDEHKSGRGWLNKVDYKPYEHSKDIQQQKADLINQINEQKQNNTFQQIEEELKTRELSDAQLLAYLHALLHSTDLTLDQKSQMISSLHSPRVRATVADFLKTLTSPRLIDNPHALKTLGELLKYLLTAYVHEKDENYRVVYAILYSSQMIYCARDGCKVYLTSYLADHGIWQEINIWKICIQKIIN